MGRLSLFLIVFLNLLLSQAQTSQSYNISGIIQDKTTGETLIKATIISIETGKWAVTNEYGFFSLKLPKGEHTISVSYVGYKEFEQKINLITDQKLIIELTDANIILGEVEISLSKNIKSQIKKVISGSINFKPKDIKQIPALLGEPDVTRAILTQPGISSVGDGASGFNVRGGNIDQNLILLDEAPIYSSSHLWGFFSIFNTDAVKDMQLYKGGIPARYGGRASSVLDIRQREGSIKKFKGEGGIGLLFSRLTLEGPIKKNKVSYLISGRRSYFDLFFPFFQSIKDNKVYFHDFNAKLSWNINQNNKLFVSSYLGADVIKIKESQDKNSPEFDFQWKNATTTLRWNSIFSNKLFMNLSGVYSKYDYALSTKNISIIRSAKNSISFDWKSAVESWILNPDFTYYLNNDTKIRFGMDNTLYKFVPAKVKKDSQNINYGTEKGLEIAPYLSYQQFFDRLHINVGLRYSWFANIGSYEVAFYKPNLPKTEFSVIKLKKFAKGEIIKSYGNIEPRIALKYDLSDKEVVKLGYNRMFQYIHFMSNTHAALPFDIWRPSGYHIKPLEVNQLSAGYAYETKNEDYNFSADIYYKTFKNQVEYKNGSNLFLRKYIETQLLPSVGYSYGVELAVFKTKGKLTGNTNYTYSVTRRKTTSKFDSENLNNGNYFPSNFDRPHMFNLTTNYKLNDRWNVGAFFTYQTGRPTTYPTGKFIIDGKEYFTYSNRNAYRLTDTHRLDLSITYTFKRKEGKRWNGSLVFGVYNIYGRKNAFSTYPTVKDNQLKIFKFSVIGTQIPFITYNFKF